MRRKRWGAGQRRAVRGSLFVHRRRADHDLAGEGILVLEEVEIAGTGRRRAADAVGSLRIRLGMDVSTEIGRLLKRTEELERLVAAMLEAREHRI